MVDVTPGLLDRNPALMAAVADVLQEAAKRIDEDGFAQHAFWDPGSGLYCTRGMISQVAIEWYGPRRGGDVMWGEVIEAIDLAMFTRLKRGIAAWNDEPGRTKEEIVWALTRIAAEVRCGVLA